MLELKLQNSSGGAKSLKSKPSSRRKCWFTVAKEKSYFYCLRLPFSLELVTVYWGGGTPHGIQ